MGSDGDTDRKSEIRKLLEETTPFDAVKKRLPRKPKPKEVIISGVGNVVGDGNTVTNNIMNFPSAPKTRVVVKTGDGVIDAEQRFILKELVEGIVETEKKILRSPRSFAAVWKAFKTHFRINSYHELPADRFDEARKYLTTSRARVMSAKSAPKKLGEDFIKQRIKAIQARCHEFSDGTARRKAYMASEFGAESLTELDATQIEQIYRHVMRWTN